jgi:hypothetical protein
MRVVGKGNVMTRHMRRQWPYSMNTMSALVVKMSNTTLCGGAGSQTRHSLCGAPPWPAMALTPPPGCARRAGAGTRRHTTWRDALGVGGSGYFPPATSFRTPERPRKNGLRMGMKSFVVVLEALCEAAMLGVEPGGLSVNMGSSAESKLASNIMRHMIL